MFEGKADNTLQTRTDLTHYYVGDGDHLLYRCYGTSFHSNIKAHLLTQLYYLSSAKKSIKHKK